MLAPYAFFGARLRRSPFLCRGPVSCPRTPARTRRGGVPPDGVPSGVPPTRRTPTPARRHPPGSPCPLAGYPRGQTVAVRVAANPQAPPKSAPERRQKQEAGSPLVRQPPVPEAPESLEITFPDGPRKTDGSTNNPTSSQEGLKTAHCTQYSTPPKTTKSPERGNPGKQHIPTDFALPGSTS